MISKGGNLSREKLTYKLHDFWNYFNSRPEYACNICHWMLSNKQILYFYRFIFWQILIGNFRKEIGYVSYYEAEPGDKPIALGIILGVVIPITAIILLLAFCIIKRQRKNGPTKNAIPDMLKDYDTVKEEEEIGLVSVKADLNGQIPYNGKSPGVCHICF